MRALSSVVVLMALTLLATGLIGGASPEVLQAPAQRSPDLAMGRVIRVSGGDLFWVMLVSGQDRVPASLLRSGDKVVVVPYLIDSPTGLECYAAQAEQQAWNLLFDRLVWLVHWGEAAIGGRLKALVYLEPLPRLGGLEDLGAEEGVLLQALMVAQGLADTSSARDPERIASHFQERLSRARVSAQRHRLGLWSCQGREGSAMVHSKG